MCDFSIGAIVHVAWLKSSWWSGANILGGASEGFKSFYFPEGASAKRIGQQNVCGSEHDDAFTGEDVSPLHHIWPFGEGGTTIIPYQDSLCLYDDQAPLAFFTNRQPTLFCARFLADAVEEALNTFLFLFAFLLV